VSHSLKSYDGLCGVIYPYSTSDRQIRCKYDWTHTGKHSWDGDPRVAYRLVGSITVEEVHRRYGTA
jgi:hypothetical protein